MYGGTCINIGCIPTKALVHSAEQVSAQETSDFASKAIAFKEAWNSKEELVSLLRRKNMIILPIIRV